MPDLDNGRMQSTVETLRAELAKYKKANGNYADLVKSGVPISTIYKITSGAVKDPGSNTVDKLFHALGVKAPRQ